MITKAERSLYTIHQLQILNDDGSTPHEFAVPIPCNSLDGALEAASRFISKGYQVMLQSTTATMLIRDEFKAPVAMTKAELEEMYTKLNMR